MCAVAVQVFLGRHGGPTATTARLLLGIGVGLLGLYLMRMSLRLYVSTRTTESEGILGMWYETRLCFAVSAASAAALVLGAMIARALAGRKAP